MSGRPLDVLEASLDEPGSDEDTVPGDIELEQVQDTTIIRGDNVVTIKA